ncbi:metastasis-suppressor KiSS-1 [Trematomus bernacchii]|uniref:Kisspeptin n=2 Tax=Pagothenia borchgrevinki TaxID=8213 RepID=A0ABD2GUX6_PAGBO|nr:metastasis-suppressor KiSS-1 [Trematomus bernacchii]
MMPRLIVMLMMASLSTEVYTTISLESPSEDQAILKALRDLSHASILSSAKTSGNIPFGKVHSADGRFHGTGWWISKVLLPQITGKRQDMSSYNFNSFGLRYGKRQEN